MVLREDNTNDPAAPFHDPLDPTNHNTTPFADANDNMWVEPNGAGGWQLTPAAVARGYDLETEYLFYLYDDQGPLWDFGGPEGAMGGFLPPMIVDCDFDDNGACDTFDIDALVRAIVDAIRQPPDLLFDLDGDGELDSNDLSQWLTDAGAMHLASGNAYLVGDANLDGVVDGEDFVLWNANKFTFTAKWTQADFTADGVTDAEDFLEWNINKFTSADDVGSVPEPASWLIAMLGLAVFARSTETKREGALCDIETSKNLFDATTGSLSHTFNDPIADADDLSVSSASA